MNQLNSTMRFMLNSPVKISVDLGTGLVRLDFQAGMHQLNVETFSMPVTLLLPLEIAQSLLLAYPTLETAVQTAIAEAEKPRTVQ